MMNFYHAVPRIVEQQLYADLPPKQHKHIDKFLFILSTVRLRYTFHRKEIEAKYKGYAPIPKSIWENIIGKGYKRYVTALETWNLLEVDETYLPKIFDKRGSGKSKGYKLPPHIAILSPTNIPVKCPYIHQNLYNWKSQEHQYKPQTDVEAYLQKQLNDFSIDPVAREYIEIQREYGITYVERINNKIEQVRESEKYLGENPMNILKCPNYQYNQEHTRFRVKLPPIAQRLMPVYKRARYTTDITLYNSIAGGYPLFMRGDNGSRLFTSFNMQTRTMRPFWLHQSGEQLVEADYSNSQPLFLCTLFLEFFTDGIPEDAIKYRELCETGLFYEFMAGACNLNLALVADYERAHFKSTVFGKIYFCPDPDKVPKWKRARYYNYITKAFEKHFPNVYRLICHYKPYQHHERLAIEMQRRERKVIVDHVCYKLMQRFNLEIPLLTIHDSIVTTKPYAAAVKEEMELVMQDLHGITPKVNSKPIARLPIALYRPLQ